jgi:peptidoglycan/LPS O-acetylase OafA/YrhL
VRNTAISTVASPDRRTVGNATEQQSSPDRPRQDAGAAPPRDRYIDTLRAGALLRVIVYHTFGFAWLPYLFPSMGIMFALAGGLVAASLDRAQHNPWRVLGKRTRRLLPPLWMLGIVLVPIMIVHGWVAVAEEGGVPLDGWALLHWVIPLGDPGASDWGYQFTTPLWYIRAYFWFLLLSPAALFLFRRWPKRMMSVPLGIAVLSGMGVFNVSLQGSASSAIVATMATFGACWMLGFAHHDGTLRHLSLRWVIPTSVALIAVGTWWTATQASWALDDDTLGQALYCLGFVLLLLRFYPSFGWLQRHPVWDKLIAVINSRAMTIYLWGNVAIFVAGAAVSSGWLPWILTVNDVTAGLSRFLLALLVIAVAVLAVGWVEDVAAQRAPRLNPWPQRAEPGAPAPGGPRDRAGGFPQPQPTLRRRSMAGALLMVGLAGILSFFWAASDHSGVAPQTTERGQTPITALDEQPPAPQAEPVVRNDNGAPIAPPAPSTSSNTEQDDRPGTDESPPVADDDAAPPAEENAAVPAPAATPEPSNDPTQAELDTTPTTQPTPTPTPSLTPTPQPTTTPTPTPTPSSTPTPQPAQSSAPTAQPTPESSSTPPPTQSPTPQPTPTPTSTPQPAQSSAPTAQATPTPESTSSAPMIEEPVGETP